MNQSFENITESNTRCQIEFWKSRRVIITPNTAKKLENDSWCLLKYLSQKSKVRTVLKIWEHTNFENDLTFWIWWRFEEVMAKIQTDKYFCGHGVCMYIYLVSSYHKHWIRFAIIKIYSPSVFQSNYILVFNSKYNEFIFQMLSLNWL